MFACVLLDTKYKIQNFNLEVCGQSQLLAKLLK